MTDKKEEKKEKDKEEKEEKKKESCHGWDGRDDIEGSLRATRRPKNQDCFGLQRKLLASLPINHIGTEITFSVYIKLFLLSDIFEIVQLPRWDDFPNHRP